MAVLSEQEGAAADQKAEAGTLRVVGHDLLKPPTHHAQTVVGTETCPEMHELPKDLGNSLRSFRNSVHRYSGQHDFDLEKLATPENVFGGESKEAHETSSSLILVNPHAILHLRNTSDRKYSTRLFRAWL